MRKGFFKVITVFLFAFLLFVNTEIASASNQINGGLVITEVMTNVLSIINPDGSREEIAAYPSGAFPLSVAIAKNGDYIVPYHGTGPHNLCRITPDGILTVIYTFPNGTYPHQAVIDNDGNFVITESMNDALSLITMDGIRTEIFKFVQDSRPIGVAIDKNGDYIVTEAGRREVPNDPCRLSKITKNGIRTVIYVFTPGTLPHYLAIDNNGNYIVGENIPGKLTRITPDGIRTVLMDLNNLSVAREFGDIGDTIINIEPGFPAVDNNGDILLPVPLANAIYRITLDGTYTEIYHPTIPIAPSGLAVLPGSLFMAPVADKTSLWPPNNKMVPVTILANVNSSVPVTLTAQVSCNERDKRDQDWTEPVIDQETGVISLFLRATRAGSGSGRVYTVTITATDANGNSATEAVSIVVPHDQGKK